MSRNPVRRNCATPHACSDDTRLKVLANSPLTWELPPEDRRSFNGHLSAWSWAEDEPLVIAGDEMHGTYLVMSGRVRVTHDTADGREITIDIAAPGDIVGPLAIGPSLATDSAWAMETTCALYLPTEALAGVVDDHPGLALAMLRMQQHRLAHARERQIGHSTQSVEQRVGSALQYLDAKLGSRQRNGSSLIQVRLRRDDIAGLASTTVESASRTMARMKKSGVIDSGREWVSILDDASLERLIAGK